MLTIILLNSVIVKMSAKLNTRVPMCATVIRTYNNFMYNSVRKLYLTSRSTVSAAVYRHAALDLLGTYAS